MSAVKVETLRLLPAIRDGSVTRDKQGFFGLNKTIIRGVSLNG
jgi:hypothetical protein